MVGSRKVAGFVSLGLGRFAVMSALGGAFFAAGGCAGQSVGDEDAGPDCYALCEKGKREKCPMSEQLLCEDHCLYEDFRAGETGCRDEYNAGLACTQSLEDICTAPSACKNEVAALFACVRAYCEDHPSAESCS